jgi:hypothetical protein
MSSPELQSLLNEAQEGASLTLSRGTVRGPLKVARTLTLVGDKTVLYGAKEQPLLIVAGGPEVRLTIRDVQFLEGAAGFGGGVHLLGKGTIVLDHCTFKQCSAAQSGGAIAAIDGMIEATACSFDDCRAVFGGAIFLGHRARATFSDCTFHALKAKQGGLIALEDGAQAMMRDCRIDDLLATESGDLALLSGNKLGQPQLRFFGCTLPQRDAHETAFVARRPGFDGVFEIQGGAA